MMALEPVAPAAGDAGSVALVNLVAELAPLPA